MAFRDVVGTAQDGVRHRDRGARPSLSRTPEELLCRARWWGRPGAQNRYTESVLMGACGDEVLLEGEHSKCIASILTGEIWDQKASFFL